jgi:hypothetical protein
MRSVKMVNPETLVASGLPGAELVVKGLRDLGEEHYSVEAMLVLVAGPRLRRLGLAVPPCASVPRPYEHQLYALLEQTRGRDAYSRYNALIRRIVSFARALERERRPSMGHPDHAKCRSVTG